MCPRNCGVNRLKDRVGYCGAGKNIRVARAALHYWEEPCISGSIGSGTVFFSYCTLKCVFCQNYNISQCSFGKEITIDRLAEIFLELQEKGALNINLVTPTHYVPQIIEALKIAKEKGLKLPIIYNSSGYE
ncbi:MAG: radical SAM protein, partial [Clostridium sp.]|nr:radical SAM protein [Clostridium sp.]